MNSKTSHWIFYLIVVLLVIAGIGTAALRNHVTGEPLLPGAQKDVWQIEARITFVADDAVKVDLILPDQSGNFRLYHEQAASQGYGFSIVRKAGQRHGIWTRRQASGPQVLYYEASFIAVPNSGTIDPGPPIKVQPVFWPEPEATAARQLLNAALAKSSNPQSLTRELVKHLNDTSNQDAALLVGYESNRAALLTALLNQAGVPARVVEGLYLEDARRNQSLTPLVEVKGTDGKLLYQPMTGKQGVPDNLLIWNTSRNGILNVTGGVDSNVSFSMIRRSVPAEQIAQTQLSNSVFNLLGVHLLPIEAQSMFKMLFLLPIGALIVVFMRLLVGIKTSGTFMPVLIALAFLQTSLIPGLTSFILIVALGLLLRSYLAYLNLLMVARISTLIVVVITLIAFMSLAAYKLGLGTSVTVVFFPMIILAWTIERMSVLWEEEGPREVMVQGSGSLFVAIIAYGVMKIPLVEHLSFNFPELNLVLIALMLMMGQYTGYRLSELYRFRDLKQELIDAD